MDWAPVVMATVELVLFNKQSNSTESLYYENRAQGTALTGTVHIL